MQDSEKFIVDLLKEKHPELDTRPGTAVRDVLVRPQVGIVNRLLEDIGVLEDDADLSKYKTMDPAVFDMRASNWFIKRDTGKKSAGFARVFFSKAEAVEIDEGHKFVYGNAKLAFLAVAAMSLTANELTENAGAGEWYFDVNLQAIEEGVQYNIGPGQFVEFDPVSPSVIRVECVESFTNGKDVEDNTALYERLRDAITVRNLINERSINTVLKEKDDFFVKDIYVAGFGSPEMWRDYVSGGLGSFHMGNKTDIYVKMPVITRPVLYTVDGDLKIVFNAADVPVYRVISFNGSTLNLPSLSFDTDYLLRFSKDEKPFIQTALSAGTVVEVSFETVDIDTMDNYVRNSEYRVTTADLLVRGLAPVYVSFDLQYRLKNGVAPIDEAALLDAVEAHINGLKIGTPPEVSDIDLLARRGFEDIDRIVMPLTLNGKLFDFTNTEVDFSSQDVLKVTEDLPNSLSQNTVIYIADVITVVSV